MEDTDFQKIMESEIFKHARYGNLEIGRVHYEGNRNKIIRKTGKVVIFSECYSVLFTKDGNPVKRDYFTLYKYGEMAGMVSRRA